MSLTIGLRYQVGGDWNGYLDHLYNARFRSFWETLGTADPAYALLNWISTYTVGDIWLVNLICGIIFAIGLVSFAASQPRPALALIVAIPYLVIVVAIGYSRQGVAIGLAMLGLVSLSRTQSPVRFTLWIALAACFHKSAVMLVPIIALSSHRGRGWTLLWAALATGILYYLLLHDSVDYLLENYVEDEYQSQGAAIRVAMNALPAVIFLAARDRFQFSLAERRLWTNISLVALAFVPLLVVTPSTTAVDRMALYIIPLQIVILSRIPEMFRTGERDINIAILAVILYSATIQFIWLGYSSNAMSWIPYQIFPIL